MSKPFVFKRVSLGTGNGVYVWLIWVLASMSGGGIAGLAADLFGPLALLSFGGLLALPQALVLRRVRIRAYTWILATEAGTLLGGIVALCVWFVFLVAGGELATNRLGVPLIMCVIGIVAGTTIGTVQLWSAFSGRRHPGPWWILISALGGIALEPLGEEIFTTFLTGGRVVSLFIGPWEMLPVPLGFVCGGVYGLLTGSLVAGISASTVATVEPAATNSSRTI